MLREIAVTPDFFRVRKKESFDQFRLRLRALKDRAARGNHEPSAVLVAGLRSSGAQSEWLEEAVSATKAIRNQNARVEAEALLTRLYDFLTLRPPAAAKPADDLAWAKEAVATHRREPLSRLIASGEPPESDLAFSAPDTIDDECLWKDAGPGWSPTGSLQEQVATLRPLLVHSDFLVVQAPHAQERGFLCEVARSALNRPDGFRTPEIEFHTNRGKRNDRGRAHLRAVLGGKKLSDQVKWYQWDRLSERFLLGGRLVPSGTQSLHSVRWGVHLGHLPWEGKQRLESTWWSLLPRTACEARLSFLSDATDLDQL